MSDEALKELREVKGLLILLLQKLGATSEEIAQTLGVGASTVRRNHPGGHVKDAVVEVVRGKVPPSPS